MKKPDNTTYLAILVIVLALGIRLYHLGTESLWIDEGFSLRDTHSLDLLNETRPLYFLFMQGWMKLIGSHSEFFLRLPAALFGTAGVGVLFVIGRRMMGARTALLASLFMAISVLQINHSREIRMYTLVSLVTLLSTYFLMLSVEKKRAIYVIGYALFALAGLLTSALTVFVMVAHGIFLLFYLKAYRPASYWLITTQLAIVGAWYPWARNNAQAAGAYGEGYTSILDKPTLRGVVEFFGKFFIWKWSDPGKMLVLASLVFSLVVIALVLQSLKGTKKADSGVVLAWLWLVVPMACTIAASYTVANMWMIHYLIAVSPAVFLLAARGISALNNRRLASIAVLFVCAVTLGRLGLYMKKHIRPEWRPAVSYIQAHEMPGDAIGVYYGGNQYVFQYYYHGKSKWSPLGDDQKMGNKFRGWNSRRASALIDGPASSAERFWLVLSNHEYAGGPVIKEYASSHYKILDHKYYSQVELILLSPNRTVQASTR